MELTYPYQRLLKSITQDKPLSLSQSTLVPVHEFKRAMPNVMKIPSQDWKKVVADLKRIGVAEYRNGDHSLIIRGNYTKLPQER